MKRLLVLMAVFVFSFIEVTQAQSDDILAKKVTASITSKYPPSNVEVTVKDDGWVTLTGRADLLYDKEMMYEAAAHIFGVKKITNDITVIPKTIEGNEEPGILPNKILEQNVTNLLMKNTEIQEPDKIKIIADNALITLSGRVHYYKEKIMAGTVASQVTGVQAIANNIKVMSAKKAKTDNEIEAMLLSVLNEDFPLVDRSKMNLKVENGKVTVWGTVSNLWIKDNIVKEFSSIEGVTEVVNNLKVNFELSS